VENDQSHKVAELTDLINNQSSLLVALRDKCSGLERDNRLLVERILNQSLMMNEMMLHVVALGAEQSKHTLQLLELSQVIKSSTAQQDQHSPPNHVETFPDPPFSKTHDGDVPKGRLFFPVYYLAVIRYCHTRSVFLFNQPIFPAFFRFGLVQRMKTLCNNWSGFYTSDALPVTPLKCQTCMPSRAHIHILHNVTT